MYYYDDDDGNGDDMGDMTRLTMILQLPTRSVDLVLWVGVEGRENK